MQIWLRRRVKGIVVARTAYNGMEERDSAAEHPESTFESRFALPVMWSGQGKRWYGPWHFDQFHFHFQWLTKQKRSHLQQTICEYNQRIIFHQVSKTIIHGNVEDVISCEHCFKIWWAYALVGEKGSEEKIEANISRVNNRFYEDFIFLLALKEQLGPCMSGYHL